MIKSNSSFVTISVNAIQTHSIFIYPTDLRYARLVFSTTTGDSLFKVKHIKAMCRFEQKQISREQSFTNSCVTSGRKCCRSWSLGNYIAFLRNKTNCFDLTSADVSSVLSLLQYCSGFFHNYTLVHDCEPDEYYDTSETSKSANNCPSIPSVCTHRNAVFEILHYLSDTEFLLPTQKASLSHLSLGVTYLPIAGSSSAVNLFKHLEKGPLQIGSVKVVAANFGIKNLLFQEYLVSDTMFLIISGCAIFIMIWLYCTSIFVTIMAFLAMFWSLQISYFLYMLVFEIKFFPYMNMVTVVVMIGIGADDVLIYCKIWHLAKSEKNNGTLDKIVSDTLKQASLSMLVTSLTTSAAFFSNFVSDITAIRCFGIYAGTAIMCNFLLMITWIPATIVIYEKWCNCCVFYSPDFYTAKRGMCYYLCKAPYKLYYLVCDLSRIFFEKMLPCVIVKLRIFWIILYGALGIAGLIVIFVKPKLKLPSVRGFQVFSSDHLLEKYDFEYSKKFWFEKSADDNSPTMPITVIWGVHPRDNGDKLDPNSRGSLMFDKGFKPTTANAQIWLLKFCRNLRNAEFYQLSSGFQITNCFLENFRTFMNQPCEVPRLKKNIRPCCNESTFPYPESTMQTCLNIYTQMLLRTRSIYYNSHSPGPRFSNGKVSALIVEFNSKVPYSYDYDKMNVFFTEVNRWVVQQMLMAPEEMRNGWFVSDLEFYDLLNSLANGVPLAIGVSLSVAAVVTFFTTLNVLISLYAIISITLGIFVTIACLVLLGWQLNVLESVIITVAIGLSIDFNLHYGVAYRLSPDLDREMRVVCSISRMGSPITMAALTTFLAGAFMMPSTVLAYRQFGIFSMIIMTVSWLYSTFFFQSLLRTIGPRGGFGQFNWPALDCCSSNPREHIDKTVYALSESTVSSSSASYPNHTNSETHELEPLTDRISPLVHASHRHPQRSRNRTSSAKSKCNSPIVTTSRRVPLGNFQKPVVSKSSSTISCPETGISLLSDDLLDLGPTGAQEI